MRIFLIFLLVGRLLSADWFANMNFLSLPVNIWWNYYQRIFICAPKSHPLPFDRKRGPKGPKSFSMWIFEGIWISSDCIFGPIHQRLDSARWSDRVSPLLPSVLNLEHTLYWVAFLPCNAHPFAIYGNLIYWYHFSFALHLCQTLIVQVQCKEIKKSVYALLNRRVKFILRPDFHQKHPRKGIFKL